MDYKTLSSKTVFNGIILDVIHDEVQTPRLDIWRREVVVNRPACAIVPVLPDKRIVLIRQYRHAIKRLALEIPAGIIENGENPIDAAARELKEETGYTAGRMTHLTDIHTSLGFSTELIHIFIADELTAGAQKLDPDEYVTVHEYPLEKVVEMCKTGEVKDAKTITGVLLYALRTNPE